MEEIVINSVKTRKERSSNFELLRIIAMIMIVSCHLVNHCIFQQYGQEINVRNFSEGLLINKIIVAFFSPGGGVANNIFFILMGYFSIKGSNNSVLKRISKLVLQVFFYVLIAVLIFAVPYVTGIYKYPRLTNDQIAKAFFSLLMPVTSECWWFITTYIVILIFINYICSSCRKISKKCFLCIIGVTFFINAIRWTNPSRYNVFFYSLQSVLMGIYFGLYPKKNNKKELLLISFFLILGMALLCFINLYTKIQIELTTNIIKRFGIRLLDELGRNLAIIIATALFMLFDSLSFKNTVINKIAASVFGVYLFHASPFAIYFLFDYLFDLNRNYRSYLFVFNLILTNLMIFIIAFVLEFLRSKLPINKKLGDLCNKIEYECSRKI